jgi:hypothetical protein
MTKIILQAIDWTSIKLNGFTILGIFTGVSFFQVFACIGIASTIVYNTIRIIKELKKQKPS